MGIELRDTQNLIAENTLLIHFSLDGYGLWDYIQDDCGYRNVCDDEWTIMIPNHQHPLHTDAPFQINSGQIFNGTFAWNYGGIPGIDPESFDSAHSYLVQLTVYNLNCQVMNTGNSSSTGIATGLPTHTGISNNNNVSVPVPPRPPLIPSPGPRNPPNPGFPQIPVIRITGGDPTTGIQTGISDPSTGIIVSVTGIGPVIGSEGPIGPIPGQINITPGPVHNSYIQSNNNSNQNPIVQGNVRPGLIVGLNPYSGSAVIGTPIFYNVGQTFISLSGQLITRTYDPPQMGGNSSSTVISPGIINSHNLTEVGGISINNPLIPVISSLDRRDFVVGRPVATAPINQLIINEAQPGVVLNVISGRNEVPIGNPVFVSASARTINGLEIQGQISIWVQDSSGRRFYIATGPNINITGTVSAFAQATIRTDHMALGPLTIIAILESNSRAIKINSILVGLQDPMSASFSLGRESTIVQSNPDWAGGVPIPIAQDLGLGSGIQFIINEGESYRVLVSGSGSVSAIVQAPSTPSLRISIYTGAIVTPDTILVGLNTNLLVADSSDSRIIRNDIEFQPNTHVVGIDPVNTNSSPRTMLEVSRTNQSIDDLIPGWLYMSSNFSLKETTISSSSLGNVEGDIGYLNFNTPFIKSRVKLLIHGKDQYTISPNQTGIIITTDLNGFAGYSGIPILKDDWISLVAEGDGSFNPIKNRILTTKMDG